MDTMVSTGSFPALTIGPHSVGVRAPEEWLTSQHLSVGSNIWAVGELDGSISFHTKKQEWGRQIRIRIKDGSCVFVTIPALIARTRGIVPEDILTTSVDVKTGALIVQKTTKNIVDTNT